jgi:LPS sulfotransferase NodH
MRENPKGRKQRKQRKGAAVSSGNLVVILAEPRTGSTWLVYVLSMHGYAIPNGGNAQGELFNFNNATLPGWTSVEDTVLWIDRALSEASSQKQCVLKVCYDQLVQMINLANYPGATVDFLQACFPTARFVRLRRDDYIAQVVSLYMARKMNNFASTDIQANSTDPPYDFGKILYHWMTIRSSAASVFDSCCDVLQPLHLTYEELRFSTESASLKLSRYLGKNISTDIRTPVERQAMGTKARYAAQFRKDLAEWMREI